MRNLHIALPLALLALASTSHAQQALRIKCFDGNAGAAIQVNGRQVGDCPLDVLVAPGTIRVRAAKRAGPDTEQVWEQEFFLGAGSVKSVEVVLGTPQPTQAAKEREAARALAERQAALRREEENVRREAEARRQEAQALEAAIKGAEAGEPEALYALSDRHMKGKGVPLDDAKSLALLQRAVAANHPAALSALAVRMELGRRVPVDFDKAFELYQKAADAGDAAGIAGVGAAFVIGKVVPRDYAEARKWAQRAVDMGSGRAMRTMGILHEQGFGVPKSLTEAARWYQKAVEAGEPMGYAALGRLLNSGEGQNRFKAAEYFAQGAAQGDLDSRMMIGIYTLEGLGGIPVDPAKGMRLIQEVADEGFAPAQYYTAHLYWDKSNFRATRPVPADLQKARSYFELAAKSGHSEAANMLKQFPPR